MMLLARLGLKGGCGGRKILAGGDKVGRRTTEEARAEKSVRLTRTIKLILLARWLSIAKDRYAQIRGVTKLKTHSSPIQRHFQFKRKNTDTRSLIRCAAVEALGTLQL